MLAIRGHEIQYRGLAPCNADFAFHDISKIEK